MPLLQDLRRGYADAAAARAAAAALPRDTATPAWVREELKAWTPGAAKPGLSVFGHEIGPTELLILGVGLVVLLGAGK